MFERSKPSRSLVLEIQQTAIEDNVDVASLLRKAKVAAVKLKQTGAISWIDKELDGYTCSFDELPDYRKTHGTLKARNPYHGLIPFIFNEPETDELLTRAPMLEGVGTLQKLLSGQEKGSLLRLNMSAVHRNAIIGLMEVKLEPVLLLSYSQIETILSRVTSLVLNWALELEANGILGENMGFKPDDEQKASIVTQKIIAQNIGHIGDSQDNAKTNVSISSSGGQNIDQRKLAEFLEQTRSATDLLPDELKADVKKLIEQIEATENSEHQRSLLGSLRNTLEGASGNLAAQGIIQLIASIV